MFARLFTGRRLIVAVGGVTLAAFALAGFTLALLLGVAPFVPSTPQNVVFSLNANLIVVALLALLIGYRIFQLLWRRRRGGAGARLQGRVALLFGIVATAPTITLSILSIAILHAGLEQWLGDKVEQAAGRSLSIARAYQREQRLGLVRDTYALGEFLSQDPIIKSINAKEFDPDLNNFAIRRNLAEIVVFGETGEVFAKAGDVAELRSSQVPNWAIRSAKVGGAPVLIRGNPERLRSLHWLTGPERFLLVGRAVNSRLLGHVESVNQATAALAEAAGKRTEIEARLVVFFLLFGLVFTLASIWAGLMFAGALAEPIANLIQTADRVRAGDLNARVRVGPRSDEIGNLLIGFNRMTAQLEAQRDELVAANQQMDERRRFTAAVLDGVASGVLGIDDAGAIRAANRNAAAALDVREADLIGRNLEDVAPELVEALSAGGKQEREVHVVRGGRQRVLIARSVPVAGEDVGGQVVTFTDITDLLQAKRQAAWSGVARRVAHEIKNPLTPIQLSAERLKRKYLKTIEADPDVFALCCDTIIRQVGALRGMVDEFSEFARLPAPQMRQVDICKLTEEALFLVKAEHKAVAFAVDRPDGPIHIDCDPGQIVRALNNILINAVHAVEDHATGDAARPARVDVTLRHDDEHVSVLVEDTGPGFSPDLLKSALEPYVTTKDKGSGLGLAIVQRILEEHGGQLRIGNRAGGGAAVLLELAALPPRAEDAVPALPEEATT